MKLFKIFFLGLFCLLLSNNAFGKIFRNSYVAFELPANWQCALEQTEWVCRSQSVTEAKQAIIILTAKEVGPTDSFPLYEQHLKTPRNIISRGGQAGASKVIHVKKVQINNQPWIDGWHLGSEIPNYYTRYLATIKDKIAILVTFSAHKTHYTKYSKDFFTAIMSLRVIAAKGLLEKPSLGNVNPGSEVFGAPAGSTGLGTDIGTIDGNVSSDEGLDGKNSNQNNLLLGLLATLLLGSGGFFYWKKRQG